MKLFYLSLFSLLPHFVHAQMSLDNVTAFNNNGSNPLLDKAPKEWVKEQDQINGRVPHSKLVKMQIETEAMISFLHDSCFSTTDFTPVWHGEYSTSRFGIQCRSEDSRGRLTIMSNDISPLLRYLTVNGKDLAGIRPSSGLQGDSRYFEYEDEDHARTIYWLITPDSNQLPYIDEVRFTYFADAQALNLAAIAGSFDMQERHVNMTNYPVLKDQEKTGKYKIITWPTFGGADAVIAINQTYTADPEMGKVMANKDFRIALSLAINRDQIKESVFLGLGEPRQPVPAPWHPYYPGDEYAKKFTDYDYRQI